MSNITESDIENELAQHRAKVKECEARARKEALELERAQNALVAKGTALFNGQLIELASKASAYAKDAAAKLAKLPPAPAQPDVEIVNREGLEAYLAAEEAYPAARDAHREAVRSACGQLAPALRGLAHQAGAIRRRSRELGFLPYQGVHFLREDQRRPRPGALMAYAHVSGGIDLIECLARGAEAGEIRSEHCAALAELLAEPAPQTPTSSENTPARAWERIRKADDDRIRDAERAEKRARGEVLPEDAPTQTQIDVERYIDAVGAGTQRPFAERALDVPVREFRG